jgi:hypothetical protein
MFFKRIPVYIKVYSNQIEVINLKSGETASRKALEPFSNQRLVLSDFNNASKLLRIVIDDLQLKTKIFGSSFKALIQQMEKLEGGLSNIEKRALRDLAELSGASYVKIIEHTQNLSNQEALMELEKK